MTTIDVLTRMMERMFEIKDTIITDGNYLEMMNDFKVLYDINNGTNNEPERNGTLADDLLTLVQIAESQVEQIKFKDELIDQQIRMMKIKDDLIDKQSALINNYKSDSFVSKVNNFYNNYTFQELRARCIELNIKPKRSKAEMLKVLFGK